ncbi:MAG: AmmeMemoRadiSam system protein B [Planctomycetota bacterium]
MHILKADRAVLLRDPLGVSEEAREPFAISPRHYAIARLFDFERSIEDVAERFSSAAESSGFEKATPEEVENIALSLSEKCLLEDRYFEDQHAKQLDEFRASPHRVAVGPGRDYTADNFDLRIRLGGVVAGDWDLPPVPTLAGLVTPATDFGRAAKLYGRSFAALRHGARELRRVVILGAGRRPTKRLLAPCTRPYRTPLGVTDLDVEALAALSLVPGPDELAHRDTLTLERQLLFLQLVAPRVPVLPLLCGSLPPDCDSPRDETESAVRALRRVLEGEGRTVIVAATDLARWGAGHASPERPSPSNLRELRQIDAALGERLAALDAEALWREDELLARGDVGRAASLTPLYLLLRALETPGPGQDSSEGVKARRARESGDLRGSVIGYQQMQSAAEVVASAAVAIH